MTTDEIAHGSDYAAAMACYRANGRRCDACRPVNSAYHRTLVRRPAALTEAKRRRKVWRTAQLRLAQLHRVEYRELLAEGLGRDRARTVLRRRHVAEFNELYVQCLEGLP